MEKVETRNHLTIKTILTNFNFAKLNNMASPLEKVKSQGKEKKPPSAGSSMMSFSELGSEEGLYDTVEGDAVQSIKPTPFYSYHQEKTIEKVI